MTKQRTNDVSRRCSCARGPRPAGTTTRRASCKSWGSAACAAACRTTTAVADSWRRRRGGEPEGCWKEGPHRGRTPRCPAAPTHVAFLTAEAFPQGERAAAAAVAAAVAGRWRRLPASAGEGCAGVGG